MKRVMQVVAWVGGGVFMVFFLAWAGFFIWNYIDDVRVTREVERKITEQIEAEATVGETPEETFSFFLQALRDGNIDQAAVYFAPELRDGWRVQLQILQNRKFLESMIADLENQENTFALFEEKFQQADGKWYLASL